jgi:hypothetical protein
MEVFIVATVNTMVAGVCGTADLLGDIVLVTQSDNHANIVANNVRNRIPYPGLDYDLLAPYTDVIVIRREIGKIITNKE